MLARNQLRCRRGFTLAEILIVLAVVALIAAILYPAFAAVRERARQGTCLAQLRQLGQALAMYRQDYGAAPPQSWAKSPDESYYGALAPYVKNPRIWLCPSSNPGPNVQELLSYNYRLDGEQEWVTKAALTPRTVVFFCQYHRKQIPRSQSEEQLGLPRYSGIYIVVRLDSSAERLEASKVKVTDQRITGVGAPVTSSVEMLEFPK